jgi:hypothetical protein
VSDAQDSGPVIDRRPSWEEPAVSVRTIARSLVLAAALLAAAGAGQARADTYDFSSFLPGNPSVYRFADCTVEVGVVLDPWGHPPSYFQVIGGVRVNCRSSHRWISATVREVYYQSSPSGAYYTGAPGYGSVSNSTGFGSWIAHTNGICGTGYWYTVAWVSTYENGTSAPLATPARYTAATRC